MPTTPSSDQIERQRNALATFLRFALWTAGAFIVVQMLSGVGQRQPLFLVSAAGVAALFACGLAARRLLRRGHNARAAQVIGYGILAHALVQAYLMPFADMALTISILLGVAVVLPHLEGRRLKLLLAVAVVGSLAVPLEAVWSPFQNAVSPTLGTVLLALGVPAATSLVTLLLWQYSVRTRQLLDDAQGARDQLKAILKAVSDGVTAQDPRGQLVYANDAAARLCGIDRAEQMLRTPPQQIVGRFELRDEQGQPFPFDRLPGRIATTEGRSSEALVRFRDRQTGQERWSTVSATPVLGSDGRPRLTVNVFRDLTERKRTEEAWRFLAEASAVLGSSLDFSTTLSSLARLAVPHMADWCAVDLVTPTGLEQLAMAHVDPNKMELAREFRRRRPPDPRGPRAIGHVLRTGTPDLLENITPAMLEERIPQPELRALIEQLGLRSAMVLPLTVQGRPIGALSFMFAESGRRYGAEDLVVAQEIARRASLAIENARLYSEAKQAVAARDTFLTIASHELKTPLTSLMLLVSGLRHLEATGRDAGVRLPGRLIKIEEHADYLALLVDRLLDVGRIAGGRLTLEPGPTDLVSLARSALDRLRLQAQRADCVLELEGADSLVGQWDGTRIQEVISNLVGNAIKYGPGQPVRVVIEDRGGSARLAVIDRGPGIAPEDRQRIFEQFERAAPKNFGGMGLGLWIVRQLVEAHGGSIDVVSTPGQGATFRVELPRGQRPESGGAAP